MAIPQVTYYMIGTITYTEQSATPSLNFGGSDVSLYLGSTYVSKVYLGSTLLYEGEAPSVTLISFEVGNTTYQAEQGMTWAQFVASAYNTGNWFVDGSKIRIDNSGGYIADAYSPTDTIHNGTYMIGRDYYF